MSRLFVLGFLALLASAPAQAQMAPAPCDAADPAQFRTCQQQNLKAARKALDGKITAACRRQGLKGPQILACRADMMAKVAETIQ